MTSIRRRFFITALLTTILALVVSAFIFTQLFSKNYYRRVDLESTEMINQLANALNFDSNGEILEPTLQNDRRFKKAYSGTYWQIEDFETGQRLRSDSLWDFVIALPNDDHDIGTIHRYTLPGPNDSQLVVQERVLIFQGPDHARTIHLSVGQDRSIIEKAVRDFAFDLIPFMLLLGGVLVFAAITQLTFGLRPIISLQQGLKAINERKSSRLDGAFPIELEDSITAINQLLENQEKSLVNARRRASDLAHGLKTPLTILRNDAQKLRSEGSFELAEEIEQTAQIMQSHIDGELTKSRIVSFPQQRKSDANINIVTNEIVRTLKRVPDFSELEWLIDVPEHLSVRVDPHDLRELIGNLLENASKWANSRVSVSINMSHEAAQLVITDDGPGVDDNKIRGLTERGKRLDSKVPGTGLGLSIVAQIVEVYELALSISNRTDTKGLEVKVEFPRL